MAADAADVVDREVVVAQDREDAERGLQVAEESGGLLDVPAAPVDEVAGQGDDVRLLGLGALERVLDVAGRDVRAAVEVGEMGDLEAVERGRQPADRHRDAVDLQPGRFDVAGIADPCPRTADEPRDPRLESWAMRNRACVLAEIRRFHEISLGIPPERF